MSTDADRAGFGRKEAPSLLDQAIDARIDERVAVLASRLGAEIAREVTDRLSSLSATARSGTQLLLTVRAAAERLSLSRSTVYELIRRGDLSSVKIGGTRRICPDALDAFRARLGDDQGPSARSDVTTRTRGVTSRPREARSGREDG